MLIQIKLSYILQILKTIAYELYGIVNLRMTTSVEIR